MVVFELGTQVMPGPDWTTSTLFLLLHVAEMTSTQALVEMEILLIFCPGWPRTVILPISTS
jgi:hypothetical protein